MNKITNITKQEAIDILNKSTLLFDEKYCNSKLKKMAQSIVLDYKDKFPVVLSIMKGSVVFVGKLLPLLDIPIEFDYIHVSRYNDQLVGKDLKWIRPITLDVYGKDVLVLDDILDEGHTMKFIFDEVQKLGAKSCKCAVFANKTLEKTKPINMEFNYFCVQVPSKYIFGFGMDIKGLWRNLPGIYVYENN